MIPNEHALREARRTIAAFERKLNDPHIGAAARALAARAHRLFQLQAETMMAQALNAFERPEVMQ
jgi:hypothetical protein